MVIAVVSICDRTSCIQELRDDLPLTCEKFNAKKPSNSYIHNAGERGENVIQTKIEGPGIIVVTLSHTLMV